MRFSKWALAIVIAVFVWEAAHCHDRLTLEDFRVYESASVLVAEHRSNDIYDGADTGEDPQLRFAKPDSIFGQVGRSVGQDPVRLYVYPPLLADLTVPLTWVDPVTAGRAWIAYNVLAVLAICAMLVNLLGIPWKSLGPLALVAGAFTFHPVIQCIVWGQITITLLLLWTAGVFFYARDRRMLAAIAFAIATAIKLTPLIVVGPFLIWREWKLLRDYALAMVGCVVVMCVMNQPGSLPHYFLHVVPSMSAGVPDFNNKSLVASIQVTYKIWKSARLHEAVTLIPHAVVSASKFAALCLVVAALALTARFRSVINSSNRIMTLGLFAMLSVAVSPVSWKHAYVVALLGLVCLWAEAIATEASLGYALFLTLCTVEIGWSVVSLFIAGHLHSIALAAWVTPLAAIAPVIYRLASGLPSRASEIRPRVVHTVAS
jgi:hypothetical protein